MFISWLIPWAFFSLSFHSIHIELLHFWGREVLHSLPILLTSVHVATIWFPDWRRHGAGNHFQRERIFRHQFDARWYKSERHVMLPSLTANRRRIRGQRELLWRLLLLCKSRLCSSLCFIFNLSAQWNAENVLSSYQSLMHIHITSFIH